MHASIAEAQQAAKDAALAAIVERHPATVEIEGELPRAGATMGGEGFGFDQSGHPEINQLATVVIPKIEIDFAPVRGRSLVIDGRGFSIETVQGHLEAERHWLLRCKRTPGADDED